MGKHYTTEVETEELELERNPTTLAAPVAAAIAAVIAEGIRGITAKVSASTKDARAVASRAAARGKAWASERYGTHRPNQTDRMFNDSGELADGIVAAPSDDHARGAFDVNAPANRFGPDVSAARRMFERLAELVPALRDPTIAPKVAAALETAAARVLRRGATKRKTY